MDKATYIDFDKYSFADFCSAESYGKFYLNYIKPFFIIKTNKMADKVIKCKIDVLKINKDWLFVGEKGTYLNFTLLYNEKTDTYSNNGMIVQDVPSEVYKKEKELPVTEPRSKGEILGNCREMAPKGTTRSESSPLSETGTIGATQDNDDLPF